MNVKVNYLNTCEFLGLLLGVIRNYHAVQTSQEMMMTPSWSTGLKERANVLCWMFHKASKLFFLKAQCFCFGQVITSLLYRLCWTQSAFLRYLVLFTFHSAPLAGSFQHFPRRVVIHPLVRWLLGLFFLNYMHLSDSLYLWFVNIKHCRIWSFRPLLLRTEEEMWYWKSALIVPKWSSMVCPLETS